MVENEEVKMKCEIGNFKTLATGNGTAQIDCDDEFVEHCVNEYINAALKDYIKKGKCKCKQNSVGQDK
jgi:hypothetical protein